jgi:hypothetical protein
MSRRRSGAHFVECEWWRGTEKRVGFLKRACLPMASMLLVRPRRRFRLSRFKGNYIIRRTDAPEKRHQNQFAQGRLECPCQNWGLCLLTTSAKPLRRPLVRFGAAPWRTLKAGTASALAVLTY